MSFPSTLETLKSNWIPGEARINHYTAHNDIARILLALQTRVGVTGSADTTSLDYQIESGWLPANETWTYATASTFTIAGDKTGKYQAGDRIKLTNPTVKYFVVLKVVFSAGTTTITVTAGTDYTLDNSAITLPFYSHQANPIGWPDWFTYAPVATGFSSPPTISYAKARFIGNTVDISVNYSANGISNATTFTIPTIASIKAIGGSWGSGGYAVDNGATLAAVYPYITHNATAITMAKSMDNPSSWTAANGKRGECFITFHWTL